jgi:hypothetical protein
MSNNNILERILITETPTQLMDDALFHSLADWLNKLIFDDFDKLLTLLYRIDVSEHKLKNMLAEHPGADAGEIIAQLIIDRQLQKIRLKQAMQYDDDTSCEEERW